MWVCVAAWRVIERLCVTSCPRSDRGDCGGECFGVVGRTAHYFLPKRHGPCLYPWTDRRADMALLGESGRRVAVVRRVGVGCRALSLLGRRSVKLRWAHLVLPRSIIFTLPFALPFSTPLPFPVAVRLGVLGRPSWLAPDGGRGHDLSRAKRAGAWATPFQTIPSHAGRAPKGWESLRFGWRSFPSLLPSWSRG